MRYPCDHSTLRENCRRLFLICVAASTWSGLGCAISTAPIAKRHTPPAFTIDSGDTFLPTAGPPPLGLPYPEHYQKSGPPPLASKWGGWVRASYSEGRGADLASFRANNCFAEHFEYFENLLLRVERGDLPALRRQAETTRGYLKEANCSALLVIIDGHLAYVLARNLVECGSYATEYTRQADRTFTMRAQVVVDAYKSQVGPVSAASRKIVQLQTSPAKSSGKRAPQLLFVANATVTIR